MGTGTILLIAIPGAILVVLLFFLLGSGDHLSTNQRVERDAQVLADRGDLAGALRLAEARGDRGGADWDRLARMMDTWKRTVESAPAAANEDEARRELVKIQAVTTTTEFRVANPRSEGEIARMLREFLGKYPGTGPASQVLHAEFEPYTTFQRILRENPVGDASPDALLEKVAQDARMDATNRRFGDAIRRYERLIEQQRVALSTDAFTELKRKADERIADLEKQARASFDASMAEIRGLAGSGDTIGAKAKLAVLIQAIGVPALVREAEAYRDSLK
jgi:hypothetical protein